MAPDELSYKSWGCISIGHLYWTHPIQNEYIKVDRNPWVGSNVVNVEGTSFLHVDCFKSKYPECKLIQ